MSLSEANRQVIILIPSSASILSYVRWRPIDPESVTSHALAMCMSGCEVGGGG